MGLVIPKNMRKKLSQLNYLILVGTYFSAVFQGLLQGGIVGNGIAVKKKHGDEWSEACEWAAQMFQEGTRRQGQCYQVK